MAVRIGLAIPGRFGDGIFADANAFWRWVDLCENSPIDSLWQSDRLISQTPHFEAMSVMAALAGATRRIKFGMNALSVSFRDPLVLAKQCATIDCLSNGRLLPVFGLGANSLAEWAATGRDTKGRGRRADEFLQIVSRLLAGETVTFEGRFFRYDGAHIAPLPIQNPLPMWIGGSSDAAIRRTARLGTGWQGGLTSVERTGQVVAAIKRELDAVGRTIAEDHYGATVPFRIGQADDAPVQSFLRILRGASETAVAGEDAIAVGSVEEVARMLDRYVHVGVSKFVVVPLVDSCEDLVRHTRILADELAPSVQGLA